MTSVLAGASVVIPTRGRPNLVLETVQSVLAGDDVPDDIVVVDQSEEPNGELEARAADGGGIVRYVWTPEPGVSRARNLGVQKAVHDILAFIDDDVRVHKDWFRSLVVAAVRAGPGGVITGRVLPEKPASRNGFVPSTIEDAEPVVYSGRIGLDILYSNNMAVHRSALEAVGGFDERLGAGTPFSNAEDNDLAHRLLEAGYEIRYDPGPTVEHRAWRTGRDYVPLRWSYARGQGAFYAKHLDLRDRYMLGRVRHDLSEHTVRLIRYLPSEPRKVAGQVAHLIGLLTGLVQWLVTRPREP